MEETSLSNIITSTASIAVLTIAQGTEYQDRVKCGIENKRAYCQKHGHDFICYKDTLDPSRHIYWSKILLVLKALETTSYEWIVWMDADTLVMNQGIKIEDIIDEKHNLFITTDHSGGVNSGVFFIRNCEWSVQFLRNVYARTDCLSHYFPEQTAIALELEKRKLGSQTMILPQRIFNSYPIEIIGHSLNSSFQVGDFIIHFHSARNEDLTHLFNKYSSYIINDRDRFTVDQYLGCYGFNLSPVHSQNNEGYMSDEQKNQFKERLALYPYIESILEIGLNGGHSAENFFRCCKNLKKFVSFDLNMHLYTFHAVDYFSHREKGKFEFVQGDSAVTVPKYAHLFPHQKFDLIYIDGKHTYEACTQDIINCKNLAHPNTILWVDDCTNFIHDVILILQYKGVIEMNGLNHCCGHQGDRSWLQASYCFPALNSIA